MFLKYDLSQSISCSDCKFSSCFVSLLFGRDIQFEIFHYVSARSGSLVLRWQAPEGSVLFFVFERVQTFECALSSICSVWDVMWATTHTHTHTHKSMWESVSAQVCLAFHNAKCHSYTGCDKLTLLASQALWMFWMTVNSWQRFIMVYGWMWGQLPFSRRPLLSPSAVTILWQLHHQHETTWTLKNKNWCINNFHSEFASEFHN